MLINHTMRRCLVSCLLLLISLSAQSSPPSWKIVPAESQLTFTATQNGAAVSGEFKTFTGTILVDPNDLKNSSIEITVDISSISASYAQLKEILVSPDWFNAKLFPKAVFKATQVEKTGEKAFQAKGTLTIRDKSVSVTLVFSGEQPEPNKGIVLGTTQIKRSQFGVGQGDWAGTDEIKDDVAISFKIVAIKQQ